MLSGKGSKNPVIILTIGYLTQFVDYYPREADYQAIGEEKPNTQDRYHQAAVFYRKAIVLDNKIAITNLKKLIEWKQYTVSKEDVTDFLWQV